MAQDAPKFWQFWRNQGEVTPAPIPAAPIPAPASADYAPAESSALVLRVGLLLPLSGPQAAVGQAALQGAQLALYSNLPTPVALLVFDTVSDGPQSAYQAAVQAGAMVIIGPVFAADLRGLGDMTKTTVPLWSLSNDWQQASATTHILGPTPQAEIPQILQQLAQQGVRLLQVLAPDTPYGRAVVATAQQVSQTSALRVESPQIYAPQNTAAMQTAVQKLLAALPKPGSAGAEYHAVLIAETPARLMAMENGWQNVLRDAGWDRPPLLIGLGLWAELASGNFPLLAQARLALPDFGAVQNFSRRYEQYFQTPPPGMAMLSYGAVQGLSRLAPLQQQSSQPWPEFLARTLVVDTEYGTWRQIAPGLWQRPLVLQAWRQGN